MRRIYKIIFFNLFLYFVLCIITGCAEYFYPDREPYAGEPITPEQIAEISESIAESKAIAESEKAALNTEADTEPPFVPDTDNLGNTIVYWTYNGSVWHINSKCSALSRSLKIESGTEESAFSSGKERLCKKCSELLLEEENIPEE